MRIILALLFVLLASAAHAQEAGGCDASRLMADVEVGPRWTSWGADLSNSRYQPRDRAGLTAADLSRLKFTWALGLPDSSHAWSQPTVAGGRVFVGSQGGRIYALNAKTASIGRFRRRALPAPP